MSVETGSEDASGLGISHAYARDLLSAIRHEIAHTWTPELTSSAAKMTAKMADDALTLLLYQDERAAADKRFVKSRAEVIGGALQHLEAMPEADQEAIKKEVEAASTDLAPGRPPEAGLSTENTLERILRAMLEKSPQASAPFQAAVTQIVRKTINSTTAAAEEQAAWAKAERAADLEMRERAQAKLTPERLEAYWRKRFPESPNARVTSLRELSGGFSKTTLLFEVADWEAQPASLVMRRDVLGGATETSVVEEYPVLVVARANGLPVPDVLFLENDPAELDRCFLVMRKAPGEPGGDLWRPSPGCTPETGHDLARTLARLHTLDSAEITPSSNETPSEKMRQYFATWRSAWYRKRTGPDPVMEACLSWIEQNMPAPPPRLCFVHGDPGFWNILIEDGRITALLDWELGHVGDPVEDLSYVKPFIENFMSWDAFLETYRTSGGGAYSDERDGYYAVWRDVRNAICAQFAEHAFLTRRNPELRMAHCGLVSYKLLLTRAARRIAENDFGK